MFAALALMGLQGCGQNTRDDCILRLFEELLPAYQCVPEYGAGLGIQGNGGDWRSIISDLKTYHNNVFIKRFEEYR